MALTLSGQARGRVAIRMSDHKSLTWLAHDSNPKHPALETDALSRGDKKKREEEDGENEETKEDGGRGEKEEEEEEEEKSKNDK